MEEDTKFCSQCGQRKPLDEFYVDRTRAKPRPQSYCKVCQAAYRKARYVPKPVVHASHCKQCGVELVIDGRRTKPQVFCSRKCTWTWHNAQQTRDYRRDSLLRSTFGITLDEYNERLVAQGGQCLLCATPEAESRHGVLDVDHDHNSGRVRGLLCHRCNWALGILGDDPALLRRAADYLEAPVSV